MFLHTVGHDLRVRNSVFQFCRSGETVSRYFHMVLSSLLSLYGDVVKPATAANSPVDCSVERNWHHYFKDAVGAIDGTQDRSLAKAHPEAVGVKEKPMKFYDQWQVIIGHEQATDDFYGDSVPLDEFANPNSTQRDTTPSGFNTTQPSVGPTQRRKRPRALEEGINHGITGMVEAANRIAATFEGPNWQKIKAALEDMSELEEDDIYQAAELFNKDPWMARYFLSLSEGRKLAWIKMKLQNI
ncbi:hypothetical protein C5167_030721 [Papaver somniferum]|nr:hypothetical protein C5167_030721 [Papaver somniferum]